MPVKSSNSTKFFRKVGEAVLGSGKTARKPEKGAKKPRETQKQKPKGDIPKRLRGFFERRHAGWPEYIMLKVQLAIIAMFVTAVAYLVFLQTLPFIFIPLTLAFSAYLIYIAATQLRVAFERDYPAYRSFVAMSIAIAWVFIIVLRYSAMTFSLETIQLAIIPPLAAIGFVVVAFGTFRLKYGRNFTYGRVEGIYGRRAVVRVGYDICSNVKAGLYPVESFIKVRRGDIVKISVERPMMGLKGARVRAVLGKAK